MAYTGLARAGHHMKWSLLVTGIILLAPDCLADNPFFVTYTAKMEEARSLEIETRSITGKPGDQNRFGASAVEFEYGTTGWWTSELYLDGQVTTSESAIYTGYRVENRFRVRPREHWINPVLYVEFEHLNDADKALLEIVGHDGKADLAGPNWFARQFWTTELETKLILDSNFKGWTLAENLIAERELSAGAPWEFGYAVGVSRALGRGSSRCNFCRGLTAGIEAYGGIGTNQSFGLQNTSHYIGPTLAWEPEHGPAFKISPNFGLTSTSAGVLLRIGMSYEIDDFGRQIKNLFR